MPLAHRLQSLSDDELLHRLNELLARSRRVESDLVAHIAEVDARRLYARKACPSMFAYCTEVLHLSEAEAYLRIAAARASREHPVLLRMLADGRLHLSGIAKLAPRLTPENRDALLEQAARRTKAQILELLAALNPRPDVVARTRRLPAPRTAPPATAEVPRSDKPPTVASLPLPTQGGQSLQLRPDAVRPNSTTHPPSTAPSVEPLAPARYKVQFTASAQLREKLERLQALTPGADIARIIEQAVTERLERLEGRRFGRVKKPRKSVEEADTTLSSRYIPAPIRRAVHERDGGRCAYTDESGRRCAARRNLEFHHHGRAFGRGGEHSLRNLRLMCREHNALLAEREYGRKAMARYRRPTGVSESSSTYCIASNVDRAAPAPFGSPPRPGTHLGGGSQPER